MLGDLMLVVEGGFEHFRASHPYPWLVYGGQKQDLRRPGDPGTPDVMPPGAPGAAKKHRNMLAFGLLPSRKNETRALAVGSCPSADVTIPDENIAEHHAFIREREGEYFLAAGPDAKLVSLRLNHALVSAADSQGVPLRSGDIVALQDVELRFLSPQGMYDLIHDLG